MTRRRIILLAAIAAGLLIVVIVTATVTRAVPSPRMPAVAANPPGAAEPGPGYAGLVDEAWAGRISQATGIPTVAVIAYAGGAIGANDLFPGCGIGWNTLAGLGLIESDHGRHDGSSADATGRVEPPIYGVALNGDGVQTISDTDDGEIDADTEHDRAVGPMQFIPQTWRSWAIDANGDLVADPQNIMDASLAAGDYLCYMSGGMATEEGWLAGIAAYNAGGAYLRDVAAAAQRYADAAATVAR